jgi:hypothetical protein
LDQYPVWTWDDDNEGLLPISDSEPSTDEYTPLFIKARFDTSGHSFDGYLIGGPSYYAFGLFVGDKSFVMNLNMPDRMQRHLDEICELLDCKPFKLLPIRYTSPVRLKGGHRIEGALNL